MDIVVRIADAWLPNFSPDDRLTLTATFKRYRQLILGFFAQLADYWPDISSLKLLFLYHALGCLLLINKRKIDVAKLNLWLAYYLAVDRIVFDLEPSSVKYLRGLLKGEKVTTEDADLLYVTSLLGEIGRSPQLLALFEAQLSSAKYKSRSDYGESLYENVTVKLGKTLMNAFAISFDVPIDTTDVGYILIVISEIDDNRIGIFRYHQEVKTLELFLLELAYQISSLPPTHNMLKPLILSCLVYYILLDRCVSKEWMTRLLCHVPLSLV